MMEWTHGCMESFVRVGIPATSVRGDQPVYLEEFSTAMNVEAVRILTPFRLTIPGASSVAPEDEFTYQDCI